MDAVDRVEVLMPQGWKEGWHPCYFY